MRDDNYTADLTLAAVGDISFARSSSEFFHSQGADFLFAGIKDDLALADIRFANFESVLIPKDFPLEKSSGRPLFSYDDVLPAVEPLNFDIMHIASNHILDCGWRGLLHTFDKLQELGIQTLGAGADQETARALRIVRKKNTSVGFLGYLQAGDWTLQGGGGRVAYIDADRIIEDIRKHRKNVDVLVISLHADIEFQEAPSIPRLNLCRRIAEAGADLILCHHPHVPQGVESWGNCLINYSLGNVLFDVNGYQLSNSQNTKRSQIFYVDIKDGKISDWRRKYFELQPEEGGRALPVKKENIAEEEKYYNKLDAYLSNPRKLREIWYNSCRSRIEKFLQRIHADKTENAEDFIKNFTRCLFSDMSYEYLDGIVELAELEHEKKLKGDFEFKRPFAVYES